MRRLTLLSAPLPLLLASCAHVAADAPSTRTVEGRVVAIDTAPWAFDGSGVLTVDTGRGVVRVALPARWNLCSGRGLDAAGELKAGDRVRVTGTAGNDGTVDACTPPDGLLQRL